MLKRIRCALVPALVVAMALPPGVRAEEGDWELTPQSEAALDRGLQWLARNQGPEGNWESTDLGLVSLGALAFLAAGHAPGKGKYGETINRALDYVLKNAKPSGLLNAGIAQRDMYNHGLSTFVLGQAHGMTDDPRISPVLDRALKLVAYTQCGDGGWGYQAVKGPHGSDLSLAVMQAKALRSAVDSGLEVPPEVIQAAIKSVRDHYRSASGRNGDDAAIKLEAGTFTYAGSLRRSEPGVLDTTAMAAAGVVCLQEFGEYDDWRIPKNMDIIATKVGRIKERPRTGELPLDAYTLYYVGQAIYQVGGNHWQNMYPTLRNALVANQISNPADPRTDGGWRDIGHVHGKPGELYGTAVACFILAMPNRYLPILQEGKIDSLKQRYQNEKP